MLKVKSLLNCLFFFIVVHAAEQYSIVFVHVGNNFPSYLIDALEQARLFNKTCDIIVVGNEIAFNQNPNKHKFKKQNIIEITCESLPETASHSRFKKTSRLDNHFRDGFWNKTTERFFYLDKVMQVRNLKNVFHLENDNLLYVDLNELLPIFEKYYLHMANVFESDARSIPSFIYIKNQDAIINFVSYVADHAGNAINDMHTIADFRNQVGNECTKHLPVIPKEYSLDYELKNQIGQVPQNTCLFSLYIDEFNSVFDGAAYGQFLGGIDPRNGKSTPGFINESTFFNPSHFEYKWIKDKENRTVPYLLYKNKLYRINNLHMHCKDLKKFKS